MYSYEQKLKAVELYIQYDHSAVSVINELAYPNYKSLVAWYRQYIKTDYLAKKNDPYRKYTAEQCSAAVKHYLEHGKCVSRTVRVLGYPSRPLLTEWIKEDGPEETSPGRKSQSLVQLSKEQKEQVAIALCTRDGSAQEIADKYNVSKCSVYNWAWDLLGKGNVSPMPKKKPDRGAHYRWPGWSGRMGNAGLTRSMSKKGIGRKLCFQ